MRLRIAITIFSCLALIFSLLSYTSSRTYPPNESITYITNQAVLDDQLPREVNRYLESRLKRYFKANDATPQELTVKDGKITRTESGYSFLLTDPAITNITEEESERDLPLDTLEILIEVQNYGNFFAISVYVDGQIQDIS